MENEKDIEIGVLDITLNMGIGVGSGAMLFGGVMLLNTAIKTKDWKMMVMAGLALVGGFYVAKHFVIAPHISAPSPSILGGGNNSNSSNTGNNGKQDNNAPTPQGRGGTTTVNPPSNDSKGDAFTNELESWATNKKVDDGISQLLGKI